MKASWDPSVTTKVSIGWNTGALFTSFTKTVKLWVALRLGDPSSITITVIKFVLGPCSSDGVQVKTPLTESIAAPGGAFVPKLKLSVLATPPADSALTEAAGVRFLAASFSIELVTDRVETGDESVPMVAALLVALRVPLFMVMAPASAKAPPFWLNAWLPPLLIVNVLLAPIVRLPALLKGTEGL